MSKTGSGKETNDPVRTRGRIWIQGSQGTYLGYGRVVLLERIREHGSISGAARSMNMSYRHAWKLVDSMNRQGSQPVVESRAGGRGGGGAVLTEAGERSVRAFWRLYDRFKAFLEEQDLELARELAAPEPEQGEGG